MGKGSLELSVGELKFTPVPSRSDPCWGVIGCAPQVDPHWMLFHYERPAARLVLLFDHDDHARKYIGKWIDRTYLRLNHPPIKRFVARQLHDLCVDPRVSVARVDATRGLIDWLQDVVDNRLDALPQEFAETRHDVIFLPRPGDAEDGHLDNAFRAGRLALLRNSICGETITYQNPRSLKL